MKFLLLLLALFSSVAYSAPLKSGVYPIDSCSHDGEIHRPVRRSVDPSDGYVYVTYLFGHAFVTVENDTVSVSLNFRYKFTRDAILGSRPQSVSIEMPVSYVKQQKGVSYYVGAKRVTSFLGNQRVERLEIDLESKMIKITNDEKETYCYLK